MSHHSCRTFTLCNERDFNALCCCDTHTNMNTCDVHDTISYKQTHTLTHVLMHKWIYFNFLRFDACFRMAWRAWLPYISSTCYGYLLPASIWLNVKVHIIFIFGVIGVDVCVCTLFILCVRIQLVVSLVGIFCSLETDGGGGWLSRNLFEWTNRLSHSIKQHFVWSVQAFTHTHMSMPA